MDRSTAERWVTISALVVVAVYAYRRLTEATSSPVTLKKLVGIGNPVPLGSFATAWGFTFLAVAIMAEASPGLGGGFAILIATGDLLTNASSVLADVTAHESPIQQAANAPGQAAAAVGHGAAQSAAGTVSGARHAGASAAAGATSVAGGH